MPTRQRARFYFPPGSGGGAPPTIGNVVWGPDFGEGAGNDGLTNKVGVTMDLESIALVNADEIGVHVALPAIAIVENDKGIGVHQDMPAVAAVYIDKGISVHMDLDSLALAYIDKGISVHAALTALGWVQGTPKGISVHCAGTALGAPFWQSVATKTLGGATVTTDTNIVIPKPAGLAVGDFMLAFVAAIGVAVVPSFTPPAGWSVIENPASITLQKSTTYYKFADAADVAATDFTFVSTATGGTSLATGEIHRVTAVRNPSPIDVSTSETGSATDPVIDAVTTTVVNTLVFTCLSHNHLALSQTHTPPANHLERTDFQDGAAALLGSTTDTRVFAAAASTGTATVDCTEAVGTDYIGHRIALAPATLVMAS